MISDTGACGLSNFSLLAIGEFRLSTECIFAEGLLINEMTIDIFSQESEIRLNDIYGAMV